MGMILRTANHRCYLNRFTFTNAHFSHLHKCHTMQWNTIPDTDSPSLAFTLDCTWSSSKSLALAIFLTIFSSSNVSVSCCDNCSTFLSFSALYNAQIYTTKIQTRQEHMHNPLPVAGIAAAVACFPVAVGLIPFQETQSAIKTKHKLYHSTKYISTTLPVLGTDLLLQLVYMGIHLLKYMQPSKYNSQ